MRPSRLVVGGVALAIIVFVIAYFFLTTWVVRGGR